MREGWEFISLDKVCNVVGGGTPSKSNESFYNGKIFWATVRDMNQDNLEETQHKITENGLKNSSSNLIPSGNIIIATRVGLGKVCILKHDTAINQDLRGIIPKKGNILPKFLFWYFKSASDKIISAGTGATVQGVKLPFIKSLLIPHVSIKEQKQIVAILDEAFTSIDQAKANIQKNIENAKELFQSKLNDIFSQKGDGWEEKKFKDVCVLQRGFDLPKRLRKEGEYPLVSSSGIIDSHFEAKVKAPGVVTGRSGSIGNLFYIEDDFWPLNTTLYIKDFKGNFEEYVYYFIEQFDLKRFSSGAGVPTLNRNFVHDEIVFSTNNIELQMKIVNQLNHLKSETKKIESQYQQKLANLEDLKKSILQKAFAGELTSPEGTQYEKEARSASEDINTKKSPERAI